LGVRVDFQELSTTNKKGSKLSKVTIKGRKENVEEAAKRVRSTASKMVRLLLFVRLRVRELTGVRLYRPTRSLSLFLSPPLSTVDRSSVNKVPTSSVSKKSTKFESTSRKANPLQKTPNPLPLPPRSSFEVLRKELNPQRVNWSISFPTRKNTETSLLSPSPSRLSLAFSDVEELRSTKSRTIPVSLPSMSIKNRMKRLRLRFR